MTGTSNTNNRGIAHVAYGFGGRPFCGNKRAMIVTIPAEAHKWRLCARCEAKLLKLQKKGS